jgi:hypothetical protein
LALKSLRKYVADEAAKAVLTRLPRPAAWALLRTLPKEYARVRAMRHGVDGQPAQLEGFDRLRCIFVHIPKCAGTAVTARLFGRDTGHWKLADFRLLYTPREFRDYYKFAFVRNPWDRLVSSFHFLRDGGLNEADQVWGRANLARFADFDDFVLNGLPDWRIRRYMHFIPQSRFVTLPGRRGPQVDFVGKMENLAHDFKVVADRLGCDPVLEVRNKGNRNADYHPYYSLRTKAVVERYYREDIKMFGYEY